MSLRGLKWEVRADLRRRLWEASGGLCGICGEPIDPLGMDDERLTIDHILARSAGGLDILDNMQPAHYRCNRAKSRTELRLRHGMVCEGHEWSPQ